MNISRRSFLAGSSGFLTGIESLTLLRPSAAEAAAILPAKPVTLAQTKLRGYGSLAAVVRPLHTGQSSATNIQCDSPHKALLLQAKYLSDLTLLPGVVQDSLVTSHGHIPVYRTAGGVIACYVHGAEVTILAAGSVNQLKQIVREGAHPPNAASDFHARVQVPLYLDRWDKYGLLIYYAPMSPPQDVPFPGDAYNYGGDLDFVRDNQTGLVIWDKPYQVDTAEGTSNELSWAWTQENARKRGIPVHINTAYDWPVVWLSNRFREETQLRMPQFLGGYYDVGWQSGAQGALSWYSQAGEDAALGVLQKTVRRFAKDSNIVGWLEPHGETSQLPMSLMCEYGPLADTSLRQYLKARFGTLAAIGERWRGDPGHYASWNDIHAPEIAEFAGFGPHAIDLRGTWRVKYVAGPDGKPSATAPTPSEWYQPGFDDSGWDEFLAPGNDRMMSMGRTPLVYRRTVDVPAKWIAGQPEITLYVWDLSDRPENELVVYVNGAKVAGQARIGGQFRWAVFNVTKTLQPGANHVVINAPKAAICYRAYLTTEPPKQYPELGPHKNAQWADYNAWTLWARQAQMRKGAEMIRQIDPDRSINFMSPGDDIGPVTTICKDYGCRFHDTGGMAGFWTDEDSLMMAGAGLPVTAEAGNGAPNVAEFQKFFGRWITEGLNGIHYFQHLNEIRWNPEVLAEFKKNQRLYQAIGKYHVPFAEVAVLYSTRNRRLTAFPWDPRLTDLWGQAGYYSGANVAGALLDYCPRDGISEEDLSPALASRYRVVIDTNTSFLDDTALAGIESYVRNGGLFITNGQTGRHTEVEMNAWPISRLSGYAVVNARFNGPGLTAAPGQTVFTGQDWASGGGGLSLKKNAPECHDLLLWPDGSVALGMRPLGKGWIVHVGVARGGRDELNLLRQLFAHFGVNGRVPATVTSAPGLHFRHFIGNTGLQDLWALFNESDKPETTDLTFLPGVHPASLVDLVTGQPIAIERSPAGDVVRGIKLEGHQTVMYVSPRRDVASSPLEWLKLQRAWWQGTMKPPATHYPTPSEQQRFTLDLTSGWAFKRIDGQTDPEAAALAQPGVDDSAWERRDLDTWLTPDDHKSKRFLLRRKFTVPATWKSGTTFLSTGGGIHSARTFLDGMPLLDGRQSWDGASLDEVGGALKPGSSHVLTLDFLSSSPPIGAKGPAWISYLPDPHDRQSLSGEWTAYATALQKTGPLTLPGPAVNVAFLSRTVTIDRAHQGRNVVVYVSVGSGSIDAILINGARLVTSRRTSDHQFVWFNVTPMVKFGEENTVELSMNPNPSPTQIKVVEIRYYDKGFFP